MHVVHRSITIYVHDNMQSSLNTRRSFMQGRQLSVQKLQRKKVNDLFKKQYHILMLLLLLLIYEKTDS